MLVVGIVTVLSVFAVVPPVNSQSQFDSQGACEVRASENLTELCRKGVMHRLTVDIQGEGRVSVAGGHIYNETQFLFEEMSEVEIKALPLLSDQIEGDWYFVGWTGDVGGEEEDITVTMDEDKSITANFKERGPAEFELSELRVEPEEPEVGQELEISVNVTNVGERTADYTAEFFINGDYINMDEVTVESGETETASIHHTVEDAGEHRMEVGGEYITIYLEEAQEDLSYWLIMAVIVILIALVAVLGLKDSIKKSIREKEED